MKKYILITLATLSAHNAFGMQGSALDSDISVGGSQRSTKHGRIHRRHGIGKLPIRLPHAAPIIVTPALKADLTKCFLKHDRNACRRAAGKLRVKAKVTTMRGYQNVIRKACRKTKLEAICNAIPPKSIGRPIATHSLKPKHKFFGPRKVRSKVSA